MRPYGCKVEGFICQILGVFIQIRGRCGRRRILVTVTTRSARSCPVAQRARVALRKLYCACCAARQTNQFQPVFDADVGLSLLLLLRLAEGSDRFMQTPVGFGLTWHKKRRTDAEEFAQLPSQCGTDFALAGENGRQVALGHNAGQVFLPQVAGLD